MQHGEDKQGGWKSWFWMALCCVPMVAIGVLIALGYWSLR
jgi:nitrate reductase NapE component